MVGKDEGVPPDVDEELTAAFAKYQPYFGEVRDGDPHRSTLDACDGREVLVFVGWFALWTIGAIVLWKHASALQRRT